MHGEKEKKGVESDALVRGKAWRSRRIELKPVVMSTACVEVMEFKGETYLVRLDGVDAEVASKILGKRVRDEQPGESERTTIELSGGEIIHKKDKTPVKVGGMVFAANGVLWHTVSERESEELVKEINEHIHPDELFRKHRQD